MKKMIFLLSMLFASQATFADELVAVADAEKGLFRMTYRNERTCNTRMTIRDSNGNRIFTELIRNQCSFIRPYNFSQLPLYNQEPAGYGCAQVCWMSPGLWNTAAFMYNVI